VLAVIGEFYTVASWLSAFTDYLWQELPTDLPLVTNTPHLVGRQNRVLVPQLLPDTPVVFGSAYVILWEKSDEALGKSRRVWKGYTSYYLPSVSESCRTYRTVQKLLISCNQRS